MKRRCLKFAERGWVSFDDDDTVNEFVDEVTAQGEPCVVISGFGSHGRLTYVIKPRLVETFKDYLSLEIRKAEVILKRKKLALLEDNIERHDAK